MGTGMLTVPPNASSVLALVTTLHLALAALRNHRSLSSGPVSSLALVSLLLTALPWVFPSTLGLALGVAVHAAWFGTCELLVPKAVPTTAKTVAPKPSPRPVAAPPPVAAAPAKASAPKGFVQVPVLAVFDESPTIRTVRFARPDGFEFLAGQFVAVRVRVDGKDQVRCYSISSGPHVRGYLEISVKRLGVVSNALHATARPGGTLFVKAPAGAFRYPAGDDRPILLLAGGVGITPLISMLRHAVAHEPSRPVTLVYCARMEAELAFRDEVVAITRRHPQVRVCFAVSQGGSDPSIYPGRIDGSLLETTVSNLVHSLAFICGPTQMIHDMRALLTNLGVPAAQIRSEVFDAAAAAAAGLNRAGGVEPETAPARVPAPARAPTPARTAGHRMTCARTGAEVQVRAGQTLLEAAEENGVPVESLCRAGVCGTCRVQVSAGEVDCESTTLDAADQEAGFVLACVTTAKSDCTVSL